MEKNQYYEAYEKYLSQYFGEVKWKKAKIRLPFINYFSRNYGWAYAINTPEDFAKEAIKDLMTENKNLRRKGDKHV